MTETATDIPPAEAQAIAPVKGFSSGHFSRIGCQLPGACLEHCLQGDPTLAATHGCAMVKRLAQLEGQGSKRPMPADGPEQVPAVCERGYRIALSTPPEAPSK